MPPMIRTLAVGAVVSSVGCAQLAGIDNTTDKGRNADTVAIQRVSIGATLVTSDLELGGLQATYLVDDGAGATQLVPADNPATGMWRADLPDPAPVRFTLPDVPAPFPRLFSFPYRGLAVAFAPLEHPNRTPAPFAATLTVTAPLGTPAALGEVFRAYTVGSWTSRDFSAAEVPVGAAQIGPVTYALAPANSTSGRPELDRITTQDAFLVLRYTGAALTGVAEATPFDQTGTDTVTTPAMAPVVQDQQLDVKVTPAALMTRYQAVRPAVSALAMGWSVVAAPGARYASNAGPVLQSGTLTAADSGVSMVKYGNPFAARGWTTIFTLATSESRTVTPAGTTTPVTLVAGMNQFIEPSAGFELTLPAGLPFTISLDGHPLLTDDIKIAKPTAFVEVSFQSDNTTATLFNLQVLDLLPNAAGTALEPHVVLAAAGSAPTFKLPPDVLVPGHRYTLRAFCTSGGYPNIAAGDFQTRMLPLSQSYFDSALFTVMP
jgi:hypothetical protein